MRLGFGAELTHTSSAMLCVRILAFGLFLGAFPGQRLVWYLRVAIISALLFISSPYLQNSSPDLFFSILSLPQGDSWGISTLLSGAKGAEFLQEIAWGVWLGVCVSFVFYVVAILASWCKAALGVSAQHRGVSKAVEIALQLLLLHLYLQLNGVGYTVEYFARALSLTSNFTHADGVLQSLLLVTGEALRFATYLALPMFFVSVLIELFLLLPTRLFPQGFPASLFVSSRVPALCLLTSLLLYPFVDILSQSLQDSLETIRLQTLFERLKE